MRALVVTVSAMLRHASHSQAVRTLMQQWTGGTQRLGDLGSRWYPRPRGRRDRACNRSQRRWACHFLGRANDPAGSSRANRVIGHPPHQPDIRDPAGNYAMIAPIPGIRSHRFKHNSQVIHSDCTSGRFERVVMHKLVLLYFRSFISILVQNNIILVYIYI